MNGKINEALLEHLVREVGLFPPAAPHGRMERKIKETGSYEEAGMCYVADDFKVGLHYAGLAVLARDMHRYLADHPRSDAAFFEQVVSLVHGEDSKLYGGGAFPNYQGLPTDNFPEGLASAADAGQIVVVPLGDQAIVHEWTFKPGKRLFVKFCSKFKETICDKNSHSPKEQFKNLAGQAALPLTIIKNILTVGFSVGTFWYPLAVYLTILLMKTGLETYCKD